MMRKEQTIRCAARVEDRSGIALVMVLGVLSLMILLAVSFAVSMRTERVAAGNYVDTVRGRQLMQSALARAMYEINRACGTNLAAGGPPYPDWAVTNSYAVPGANTGVDFLRGSASNFVPRALWQAATNANHPARTSNYWININSTIGGTSNLIGRVAFMILNCSGLLDANFVGGINLPAMRGAGTNPVELALSQLPEIGGKYDDFRNARNADRRYETQEELNILGDFYYPATNLFVFSHAPAGYWDAAATDVALPVNVAGDDAALVARKPALLAAFDGMGFNAGEAGILFTNLVNYVEDGYVPYCPDGGNSFATPATKPVPMINAVAISNELFHSSGTEYTSRTTVLVELWAPFVDPQAGNFYLDIGCNVPGPQSVPAGFVPAAYQHVDVPAHGIPGREPYLVTGIPLLTGTANSAPGQPVAITLNNLHLQVKLGSAPGTPVDRWTVLLPSLSVTNITPDVGETNVAPVVGYECLDPRFNWNPADATQWKWTNNIALGEINNWTREYWTAHAADPHVDNDPVMHVARAPLQSVGELGYLAYAPWRTLKLIGTNAHPVVDHFAMADNPDIVYVSNTVWRGRINPNTANRDVLAALFADMPIDEAPGQVVPPMQRIIWANALQTADFIIDRYPYTNLSDVARLDWRQHCDDVYGVTATNQPQREAFIRNTAGLLNTRQQVYTVIMEAHVASAGNIPRRPSRQRAVAIIWRDAWTGEMFVRSLKLLPD